MLSHKSILGKKKTCSCFVITGNRQGIIGKFAFFALIEIVCKGILYFKETFD